ncbi:MAG: hypothetical protein KC416_09370 [Myxococcales bacterium]|nr:hypothetical protein [Myxococcales bacterium]
MIQKVRRFADLGTEDEGLTTVEYVIVLALVALVAIGAWTALGTAVNQKASEAASTIGTVN